MGKVNSPAEVLREIQELAKIGLSDLVSLAVRANFRMITGRGITRLRYSVMSLNKALEMRPEQIRLLEELRYLTRLRRLSKDRALLNFIDLNIDDVKKRLDRLD